MTGGSSRAGWSGDPATGALSVFDFLDVADGPDRVEIGLRLVCRALSELVPEGATPPDYVRFVAPDWHERPTTRARVNELMTVVAGCGAELVAERFRFEWRPGTAIAAPTGRLEFRPLRDERELLTLMTAVLHGTLDAYSRLDLARMSARDAAADHLSTELAAYSTPRAWWQVATLADGEPVGFVLPAHNRYGPIIAYLGVLPAHRGHGYIDELLAQGTRTRPSISRPASAPPPTWTTRQWHSPSPEPAGTTSNARST